MAYVTVIRDPGGYREPAYWTAECKPCNDSDVDCIVISNDETAVQYSSMFALVLAWAVHHAERCPAVRLAMIRDALAGYPRTCDVHAPDDPIRCGWRAAVADIERALGMDEDEEWL